MAFKCLLLVPLMLVMFLYGFSQTRDMPAVKTDHSPKIDGLLDDAVWQTAPVATNFIQNFPKAGELATVKTEVRILYDNSSIYIGAMLYDDPGSIRKQLTARDEEQQTDVDYFSVFLILITTIKMVSSSWSLLQMCKQMQSYHRVSLVILASMAIKHGMLFGKVKLKCLIMDGR